MRQYIPTKVVGSFVTPTPLGSIDILDGVVDGAEFFGQTQDNQIWTQEHDQNGNATRVKNNNKGGSFRITMAASSPTNTKFSRAVELDDVSESVVGPVVLKDLSGNTVGEFEDAYLTGMPDLSFGADRGSRVWTFNYGAGRVFIGGHDVV